MYENENEINTDVMFNMSNPDLLNVNYSIFGRRLSPRDLRKHMYTTDCLDIMNNLYQFRYYSYDLYANTASI